MYLATVADIRAEGVSPTVTDARIIEKITLAERYIERRCKWWFEPRALTLKLDGNERAYLYMPAPILSITSITVAQPYSAFQLDPIDLTQIAIYNRVPWQSGTDDRWNPKIEWNPAPQPSLLIQGDLSTRRLPVWTAGRQNVTIVGTFGFVDEDGGPPLDLKITARRLTIRELAPLADASADDDRKRKLIASESTDGHSYSLQDVGWAAGFLGDPEIDRVLARYTKPNAIFSTAGSGTT